MKNIEEYFHLRNSDDINLFDKSTTQNVKNSTNNMVNHVNSMELGMIVLQEKFFELDNAVFNQYICIDQLIREHFN